MTYNDHYPTKKELVKLRNFLVPNKKKNRLVKNWKNLAENADGYSMNSFRQDDDPRACRFCIAGGLYHLFKFSSFEFENSIRADYNFDLTSQHSAKEVKDLLNKIIIDMENNESKSN